MHIVILTIAELFAQVIAIIRAARGAVLSALFGAVLVAAIVSIEQVPPVLRGLRQWVLWRWELRDAKRIKVPYTAMGYRASVNRPDSCCSNLDYLLDILRQRPGFADGVGFVVTAGDPFCGIDLDDCLTHSGSVKPWAQALLQQFGDTYCEITPSGAGLRIWCLAHATQGLKKALPDGGVEVYSDLRFFVITGVRFNNAPLDIVGHQNDVDQLVNFYAPSLSNRSNRVSSKIADGDRYKVFCSVAGTLKRRGVCDEAIEAAIRAMNQHQAETPKSDIEIHKYIKKILASAARWL
jgi:hypothetical protein